MAAWETSKLSAVENHYNILEKANPHTRSRHFPGVMVKKMLFRLNYGISELWSVINKKTFVDKKDAAFLHRVKKRKGSTMAIQIGIIGCGGIAKAHIKAYQDANAEIAAVTDIDSEVAHKLAGELPNARVFADSVALIQSGIVEAVSICTPPVAHEEAAIQALKHGVHVLCEKPMAYNAGGAQRMAEAAKESEALLMPAFRHRFLPAVKQKVNCHEEYRSSRAAKSG